MEEEHHDAAIIVLSSARNTSRGFLRGRTNINMFTWRSTIFSIETAVQTSPDGRRHDDLRESHATKSPKGFKNRKTVLRISRLLSYYTETNHIRNLKGNLRSLQQHDNAGLTSSPFLHFLFIVVTCEACRDPSRDRRSPALRLTKFIMLLYRTTCPVIAIDPPMMESNPRRRERKTTSRKSPNVPRRFQNIGPYRT